MKAAVIDQFGPPEVVRIKDVPKPKIGDNEMLIKVKAAAVTAADSRIRGARFPKGFGLIGRLALGPSKPRIKTVGNTFSGVVEEAGDGVDFKPGDEVCGMTGARMGTHAEYLVVKAGKRIAKKPKTISHEEAAGVLFGGTAALYFLRDKVRVKKGEKVAVNGASGAVGTNAVQLAKYFGAEVTGVTSAGNAKLVKSLGASDIIDYKKEDLIDSGRKFDVVLDTVGNIPPKAAKNLLTNQGRAALTVAGLADMLRSGGRVKTGAATEKKEDIAFLLSLVEQGKLKVVIDKVYDFKDVAAAHKHVDTGQKVGNVLLRL